MVGTAAIVLGLAGLLAGLGNRAAIHASTASGALYWPAIVLIYLVPAGVAIARPRDRRAQLAALVMFALVTYAIKVMTTPTGLATTDELQTLRTLNDVARSHHLYAPNPIVSAYPRFPGSQVAIVGLSQLGVLTIFQSSLIVIGVEHVLMCLALFLLVEGWTSYAGAASAAVIIYATNPNFLYFDSQVAYESFALPLAVAALLTISLARRAPAPLRRRYLAAVMLCLAVCVSHHLTSYWLAGVLLLWAVIAIVRRLRRQDGAEVGGLSLTALITATAVVVWAVAVSGAETAHELGPVLTGAFSAIGHVITGSGGAKAPFKAPKVAAAVDPAWLEVFGFLSVVVAVAVMAAGIWHVRQERGHRSALLLVLLATGVAYPFAIGLRVTQASTETSSRSSEFLFFGLAAAVVEVTTIRRLRKHDRRRILTRPSILVAGGAITVTVLAVGGIAVGQPPYNRMSGTYLLGANARSVDPLSKEAAQWTARTWLPGSHFVADSTNKILIGSASNVTPEVGKSDGLPVPEMFFDPDFDDRVEKIITGDKIMYVVADQRLTKYVSVSGVYFDRDEPNAYNHGNHPLPPQTFNKFAEATLLSRVYDNGTIRIYDTAALLARLDEPAAAGGH